MPLLASFKEVWQEASERAGKPTLTVSSNGPLPAGVFVPYPHYAAGTVHMNSTNPLRCVDRSLGSFQSQLSLPLSYSILRCCFLFLLVTMTMLLKVFVVGPIILFFDQTG